MPQTRVFSEHAPQNLGEDCLGVLGWLNPDVQGVRLV